MEEPPKSRRNPLHHAVDLFLYAPLGFVSEAPSLLPRFVQRGRDQVAAAKAVGRYAVTRDPEVLGEHPGARSTLQALGLVGQADDDRSPHAGATPTGSDVVVAEPPVAVVDPTHDDTGESPFVAAPVPGVPPVAAESLAIPDYESLAASQVVPRLESLTGDELEAIRRYEASNRARRTILNKIAQLQAS